MHKNISYGNKARTEKSSSFLDSGNIALPEPLYGFACQSCTATGPLTDSPQKVIQGINAKNSGGCIAMIALIFVLSLAAIGCGWIVFATFFASRLSLCL